MTDPSSSPALTGGTAGEGTALDQARVLLDGLAEAEASPAQVADTLEAAVALLRDALQASAPD